MTRQVATASDGVALEVEFTGEALGADLHEDGVPVIFGDGTMPFPTMKAARDAAMDRLCERTRADRLAHGVKEEDLGNYPDPRFAYPIEWKTVP